MDITQKLNKQLQAFIDEQQKQRHTPDINELNRYLSNLINTQNRTPQSYFHGFSSEQMFLMSNHPFEENCPIQLRELSDEQIKEIPFMSQVLFLMHALAEKEMKLTAQGYIPPKMVTELYDMGLKDWESNYYKQKSEMKVEVVQVLRVVLKECGLVKVRSGKMSLTAKGIKLMNDGKALLYTVMRFMFFDYNTGWLDSYSNMEAGNVGRLYSLWLLHHYGDDWRNCNFYSDMYFKAFPRIEPCTGYAYRIFNRLFHHIGLCEINDNKCDEGLEWGKCSRKRKILDTIFSFVEPENNLMKGKIPT